MKKVDLFELSTEVNGAAMIVCGLANQLDNEKTDTLTAVSMQEALYGLQRYLQRIAGDLSDFGLK